MRRAVATTLFWIVLALLFNIGLYFYLGEEAAVNFLAGYLVEESLSIDNLFVFFMLFKFFHTPKEYQSKVLYWGILGAIILRTLFILLGIALFNTFPWVTYAFAIFLLYASVQMAFSIGKKNQPGTNIVMRTLSRWLPVTSEYFQDRFFIKQSKRWCATPLFIVLLCVETTDLLFAMDSIPAILGITQDPFIILTSNLFAVLGLRALYFLMENFLSWLHLLHYGLALILAFIAAKMLLEPYYTIPITYSLCFILIVLLTIALASVFDLLRKRGRS